MNPILMNSESISIAVSSSENASFIKISNILNLPFSMSSILKCLYKCQKVLQCHRHNAPLIVLFVDHNILILILWHGLKNLMVSG